MLNRVKPYINNIYQLLAITWKEDKVLFSLYFITAFLGAILLYIVYFFYKLMIDQVTMSSILNATTTLTLIIITYLFFEYVSRFVNFTFNQYYFDYLIKTKLQNVLTRLFIQKLGNLDFANLENGDVRNLIAKVETTYMHRIPEILTRINAIVYNIVALFLSLIIALKLNPMYFLVLAVVSSPIYYLRAKYGNLAWSSHHDNASNSNYLWYIRSLFTNFNTLSEMKIYNLIPYFLKKTEQLQNKILDDYKKPITIYSIFSTISFILVPIAIYFAITHFVETMDSQQFTLGDFTFFLNALFTFSGQISSILLNIGSIHENNYYLSDYFKLLSIKNTITAPKKPFIFNKIAPREIVFENVSFTYPGNTSPSLKNINLKILKGQNVAIVGHNGAGKSTLIKLLFRFYDPTEGRILVDGVDLRNIDLIHWYEHLGILFQDYAKYFLTLKENVIFGNLNNTSEEAVKSALEYAKAESLIQTLPKGLDQTIGKWFNNGVEISGGQWQKVAIARAIFRNAPILIMDEPTASIDADAETEIFQNLKQIYNNKSLIFISHRFSTVRTADKIYVLEHGKLVDHGTHEQLIKNQGLYTQFFNLQKMGYT